MAASHKPEVLAALKERKYTKHKLLGTGAFAEVWAATCNTSGQQVAIKIVSRAKYEEGLNLGAIKELQALGELGAHPNILRLLDVYVATEKLHVVLEKADCELMDMIVKGEYHLADAKAWAWQLLAGLSAMHAHWTLHRDLKPENCLLVKGVGLKIADMGLSAVWGDVHSRANPSVVTLWYRAPELLLGSHRFGPAVDAWAAGAIIAQMLRREPLFPSGPGESEAMLIQKQLASIFRITGTPLEDGNWPAAAKLPGWCDWTPAPAQPWSKVMPGCDGKAIDLVRRLCTLDPTKRLLPGAALEHPWFTARPLPTAPADLPLLPQPEKSDT